MRNRPIELKKKTIDFVVTQTWRMQYAGRFDNIVLGWMREGSGGRGASSSGQSFVLNRLGPAKVKRLTQTH